MSAGPDAIITSIHNPGIRRARSLLRRRGRSGERAFLVEGVRAVTDMLGAGISPELLYVRAEPGDLAALNALDPPCPVRLVSPDVLASISDVPHPQGVVAVVPVDAVTTAPRFDAWVEPFIVVADGIRDPGNLGTLLRSAAGGGVTQVLVTPNSVDPFNPKCVRAAMGAHFLVGLRQVTWDEALVLLAPLPLVAVADASGDHTYEEVDWTGPCALIIGSEAFGPAPESMALANAYVRIPLARNLESLNAAVAGSHLVLEVARQRRVAATFGSQEHSTVRPWMDGAQGHR